MQAAFWQMAVNSRRPGCGQGQHSHWHPLLPRGGIPLSLGLPDTSPLGGPPMTLHLGVLVAARAQLGQDLAEGS